MLLPISSVDISGNTIFTGNLVGNGGRGVCAVTNSTVDIRGNTTFIGNSATINGSGGIFVEYNSGLYISGITTFLSNSAIDLVESASAWFVDISGNTTFIGNSAIFGGGVSATSSSSMNTKYGWWEYREYHFKQCGHQQERITFSNKPCGHWHQ